MRLGGDQNVAKWEIVLQTESSTSQLLEAYINSRDVAERRKLIKFMRDAQEQESELQIDTLHSDGTQPPKTQTNSSGAQLGRTRSNATPTADGSDTTKVVAFATSIASDNDDNDDPNYEDDGSPSDEGTGSGEWGCRRWSLNPHRRIRISLIITCRILGAR